MSSSIRTKHTTEGQIFDTDSKMVGIDNHCSACISHDQSDFVGDLCVANKRVRGFGGAKQFKIWTGLIDWTWEDDDGAPHQSIIPNSYYILDGKV